MLFARILRLRSALVACAALLVVPCAVDAQRLVQPGAYVRILAPSVADSLLIGLVTGIDSASLLFAPPASARSRSVALRDIERLEVRGPGAPMTFPGALVGMVAGAVVGYAACTAISGSPHANCPRNTAAVYGGVSGLLVGALLGSPLRGRHRWHPAVTPER